MLLLPATKDIDDPAVRSDNLIRCRLGAGVGGLPGIKRTAPTHPDRFCPRPIQGAEAIHEQRSGRLGPGQDIKREQEDLRIPEDMPTVVIAGQCPGPDRHAFVGWIGRAVQMVDREPQRPLRGDIALDLNVAALPAARPGCLMRSDHGAPASTSRKAEFLPRFGVGIENVAIAPYHGDGALKKHDLPGTNSPRPGRCQFAERGWLKGGKIFLGDIRRMVQQYCVRLAFGIYF
jgi:hypothetical protein